MKTTHQTTTYPQTVEVPAPLGLVARLFRFFCRPPSPELSQDNAKYFAWRYSQCAKFFARFGVPIDFRGKTVLDFGSGLGNTSIWMKKQGAHIVVGVEPDEKWMLASRKFATEEIPDSYCLFVPSGEAARSLAYDYIISEDCMEHYSDPAAILAQWRTLLAPGGRVLIGFSPLWKSPGGGHIGYMTRLPWAHLIFPESVIMAERRRYRPEEKVWDAKTGTRYPATLSEMRGGLNKMTLARFHQVMRDTGFEIESIRVNVSESRLTRAVGLLRWLPVIGEYATKNVYAVCSAKNL